MSIYSKMNKTIWNKAKIRSLGYYFKGDTENKLQNTISRMLWYDKNLYLFFECEDSKIVARETQRDGNPFFDDCAELFLIPALKPLNTHITLEVNLNKAKNEVLFINNFESGKNFVAKW